MNDTRGDLLQIKSSERVSTQYPELNSYGIQRLWNTDFQCIRERGRSDFHILYLGQGCCYTEEDGKEITVKIHATGSFCACIRR